VEFAANDADLLDGVSPARSARQHAGLITGLQAALPDTRIVLMTMNPVSGLHRILRARLGQHHALYGALAERHDVALVNLNRRWKESGTGAPPDGLHPAPAQTAPIIAPALATVIGASLGRDCS
jgi:lysophospholipase L1-like esterase